MRMGIDGVGVSAVGSGESPLMWHCFRPPNLKVASALTGALTNKFVLMSQQLGFRFWVFLSFVWIGYVLRDDHYLMGGNDDAWSGGVFGLFGRPLSCCTILCACPLDMGILCVFCALFCLPNVG